MKEKLIVIAIVILGLFMIKVNYDFNKNITELISNGVNIKSLPLEKYTENSKNGNIINYEISPKFNVKYVGEFSCHAKLNKETFNLLRQTSTNVFDIRYLPSDPSICNVVGHEKEASWDLTIFGLILIIGSGIYLYNKS